MTYPNPMIAGINAGLIYANGCVPSWVSTTELSVSAGQLRDLSNVNDLVVPASLTINSVVIGAGGLDIGTLAASSFYTIYVIASSAGRADPAAILSLSQTGPLVPVNYDMWLMVGHVTTDGSINFLPFTMTGNGLVRTMKYDTPVAVVTTGHATTFTDVDASGLVPAIATQIKLQVSLTPNTAGNAVELRAKGSAATNGNAAMSGDVAAVAHQGQMEVTCDSAAKFQYLLSNASDAVTISVVGYQEVLGYN